MALTKVNGHFPGTSPCGFAPAAVSELLPDRKVPAAQALIREIGLVMLCVAALALAGCGEKTDGKVAAAKAPDVEAIKAKAEGGDAGAQQALGALYAKGEHLEQSYTQAAKWYRLAADQGNAKAQVALGELHEAGQGVPRDDEQAAKLYRQAAEAGDSSGQYNLAVLYVMGKGVKADQAEALKWYRLAADQGDGLAQFNVGMRYFRGHGVAADPVEAFKWHSLAAAQGIADASAVLAELKGKMTPDQLAEGRRRVAEFTAKAKP